MACFTLISWILLDISVNSLFRMMPHGLLYSHLVDTLGYFSKLTIQNDASYLALLSLHGYHGYYHQLVLMACPNNAHIHDAGSNSQSEQWRPTVRQKQQGKLVHNYNTKVSLHDIDPNGVAKISVHLSKICMEQYFWPTRNAIVSIMWKYTPCVQCRKGWQELW